MNHDVDPTLADPASSSGETRAALQQATSNGANWFYWIAALSLINSAVLLFGGQWGFIVGLGATQVIDAIAAVIAAELGSNTATIMKVVAFAGDTLVAGIFVLFGIFANKRQAWAFVVGMLLYACDGLLFLLVADWLSIGFHGFALFCIGSGFVASRKLAAMGPVVPPPEAVRPEPITP